MLFDVWNWTKTWFVNFKICILQNNKSCYVWNENNQYAFELLHSLWCSLLFLKIPRRQYAVAHLSLPFALISRRVTCSSCVTYSIYVTCLVPGCQIFLESSWCVFIQTSYSLDDSLMEWNEAKNPIRLIWLVRFKFKKTCLQRANFSQRWKRLLNICSEN